MRKPLAGKTVAVTRPRRQLRAFAGLLQRLGAEVVEFSTIRIEAAEDPQPLREAAARAGEFDWVVFTSANGVEHFWRALHGAGRGAAALDGVRLCAIGPATGDALRNRGVEPDLIPEEYVAEAVVAALAGAAHLDGKRVLLPRAAVARAVLPDGLRALGAVVTEVAAYRTCLASPDTPGFTAQLQAGEIDMITFTSSSTVRNFVQLVGSGVGGARIASIGPITSATARELGLPVHVEAVEYTAAGLAEAIRRYWTDG